MKQKVKKEIIKTKCDSVNHTRFPKEDHLPDWARRDNKVTKGDHVEMINCYVFLDFFGPESPFYQAATNSTANSQSWAATEFPSLSPAVRYIRETAVTLTAVSLMFIAVICRILYIPDSHNLEVEKRFGCQLGREFLLRRNCFSHGKYIVRWGIHLMLVLTLIVLMWRIGWPHNNARK